MSVRFPIEVYLALGADPFADPSTWSWTTDITAYCLIRDGGASIRRGKPDERGNVGPQTLNLTLNNADGRFSRLNPTGAYYGSLRKNTPIRVRIDPLNNGTWSTRFVGLVSEWPVSWDPSENDWPTRIRADGITRLLRQGKVTKSALRGTITGRNITAPVAYWPLEENAGATGASSGVSSGSPMLSYGPGVVEFGAVTGPAGSASLPDLTASGCLRGTVTGSGTVTTAGASFVAAFVETGASSVDVTSAFEFRTPGFTWSIISYRVIDVGWVELICNPDSGGFTSAAVEAELFDATFRAYTATLAQDGANIDFALKIDGTEVASNTLAGTLKAPSGDVFVNSARFDTDGTSDMLLSAGHATVWSGTAPLDLTDAASGHDGELAGARFTRLCAEYGLTGDVVA